MGTQRDREGVLVNEDIRNTTRDMQDPAEQLLMLAIAMGDGGSPSGYIEAQEAAGQRQLVNSDRLPTKVTSDGGDEPFLALGFTFGPPDKGDDLFRPATLPPGWKRQATDHAMWSKLVDEHGRERVEIFYKAAFYDRHADMRLVTHYGYLSSCLYSDQTPVLDDDWLPAPVAAAELERIADSYDERAREADSLAASRNDNYWRDRAKEHRAEAKKARDLAARIPS